jgi:exonuclease III
MATRSTSACQQIYIVAAAGELATGCPYLPDGNPASGPKFDHKLAWFERLHKYGKTLIAADAPFIMAGDSNVMPTYLDVDAPERWRDDALFRPEVRNAYAELVTLGWQMRCVTSIPASASTPFGSISVTPSPAMPGCASTTCC